LIFCTSSGKWSDLAAHCKLPRCSHFVGIQDFGKLVQNVYIRCIISDSWRVWCPSGSYQAISSRVNNAA